ncbi:hypothetical protein EV193_101370 [Herbihabitans rhizosphaerae]|uniref:Uncharacterized protein n=1 Tax=Herbihabitans rhizosphaerae TaxID=1872711 RepID=A0A4Q7L5E2_9PSEU|nr:hypothetical protein [Herbihabitans rhizosphaerae]RZS44494.1 hypothetical protein EV193_101370 [Herbihabitans rhizosphaerae]
MQPTGLQGEEHLSRLLAAMHRTPIPTSPPPHDNYLEALGLNLLAVALRLEHIERLTDTLTLADATHMTRSVSVDLNLGALTPDQMEALRSDPTASGAPPAIWLPVARHSRKHMAPVVVHNSVGEVMPRMTQVQTAKALSHGLAKAFRMYLDSDPRVDDEDELLHAIGGDLNRSRWLIEAMIATMVSHGVDRTPEPPPDRSRHRRATDSWSIQSNAEHAVRQLFTADSPFLRLLDVAASDHLLVVEVPTATPQVFLTYKAPVMPARSRRLGGREGIPGQRAFQHEFTVQYRTVIPRAVSSYHVTLEVPPEIHVRRYLLSSNVDQHAVATLAADMRAVARRYDDLRAVSPKLLELELHGIASRLAELGRRRHRDLRSFTDYLDRCYAKFSGRRPRFLEPAEGGTGLEPTPRVVSALARFAELYETDHFRKLAHDPEDAEQTSDVLPPDELNRLADLLDESDVDSDVCVDNDPRDNVGHAHWQRRPFGTESRSVEPVEATVYIALTPGPSVGSNVAKLLLALLALVIGFGVVLEPHLFDRVPLLGWLGSAAGSGADRGEGETLSSADAVVAVLLLAPSLLLVRLDIGPTKSVLGQINMLPRVVAYSSVMVAGALALAVASVQAGNLQVPFVAAISLLLFLSLLVAGDWLAKAIKRRAKVPMNTVSPRWLIAEVRGRPGRRGECAVAYSTVGADHA